MANQGSGYGGGGAGGGEKSSDSFTGSSSGKAGIIYIISFSVGTATINTRFKVKVGSTNYNVINLNHLGNWDAGKGGNSTLSRLTLTPGCGSRSTAASRSYQLSPNIKIGTSTGTYTHPELVDSTGFKSGVAIATSKLSNGSSNLKLLYRTDNSTSSFTYLTNEYVWTISSSESGSFTVPSGLTEYMAVLVQAGGGGGGGADNSWGLFNYAAGGGGGGGGGAACYVATLSPGSYTYSASVGGGGSGGGSANNSAGGGGSGGATSFEIKNSSGTQVFYLRCTGGGGGGAGKGDDAGGGGSGGSCSNNSGTKICIVDGGKGGSVGGGGGTSASGDFSFSKSTSLFSSNTTITAAKTYGSGGSVGSQNDRGGGGGASYLGNGGYY